MQRCDFCGRVAVSLLLALLMTACSFQDSDDLAVGPTPTPTPQGTEESYFRGVSECAQEIYVWETLKDVAELNNVQSQDIDDVAEGIMTFGFGRPSLKAVEGCRDALIEGLRSIESAESTGWKPWDERGDWFAYRSNVFFCYNILRKSGDIFTLANTFKFRTATVRGVADTVAQDSLPYYDAAYEGCFLGLTDAQGDKEALYDGPQGYS